MRKGDISSIAVLGVLILSMSVMVSCGYKPEEGEADTIATEWNETADDESINLNSEEKETDNEAITEALDSELTAEVPSKEDVLAMRAAVLEGMSEEEKERITENIKVANQAMEKAYLYEDLFGKLSDSSNLYWNYVDQKGEIQIGWALEKVTDYDSSSGLTYEEYAQMHGEPVMAYNRFDADNFIALMAEMRDSLKTELLKDDFDKLIQNMQLAKDTHDVKYMEEIYYILHDMDYFLLRYGIEDVGKYTEDASTVSKYYGVLNVYTAEEFDDSVFNDYERKNLELLSELDAEASQDSGVQDSFYNVDEYGCIENREQHYNNSQGQEAYYYSVDCFYLSDEINSGKYDLVNQTLQQIYDEQEKTYQTYCEEMTVDYEMDENITNEAQRVNYVSWYLVNIPYIGDDYVSILFNDITYYAGAAHPLSYFTPVTISVETGEIVTPEEVLNMSWDVIRDQTGIADENETEFNKEYGFYLTDHTLTYKYRTNFYVDEIVISR